MRTRKHDQRARWISGEGDALPARNGASAQFAAEGLEFGVERDRPLLLTQTFKQLNTHYNRRTSSAGAPLLVHRVKVQFKDDAVVCTVIDGLIFH